MSDLRSSNAPLPMIRKKGERRRPLLSTFVGNNRQMLQEISDSLSHLRKQPSGEGRHDNPLQASHRDLSQSTPNLLEKLNGKQSTSNRLDYHKKALDKIRQDLEPFHNSDQASTCSDGTGSMCNGLEPEVRTDSQMLQRLLLMGYEEEVVNQALRLCNNKSIEAAVEAIHKLAQLEGKNGYSKGLTTHGNKVIRKPSFEEKYRQGSPISDSASVRSDSPSVNCSRTFDPRQFLGNQPMLSVPGLSVFAEERQTPAPPPLPPRGVPPGLTTKGPSPAPPGYVQVGQNGKHYATEQNIVVQQTLRRMSPGQKEYSTLLPQNGQYLNGSNDLGTPQKGTSPMVPPRQPQSSLCSTQNHVPNIITHTRTLHNGSNSSSASDNTTVSTPSGRISMTLVQPPPYSKSLSLGKAGLSQKMEAASSVASQMADFHLTDELPSSGSSPQASHSPSPAPSQTHGQVYNTPHQSSPGPYRSGSWPQPPVPMSAWGARQQPIIMGAVKSREVQKPVLQTATAPVSPQVQGNTSQQNYVSSVQAQVNMPPSPQMNPQQFSVNSGQFQIEIMQPSQQVQPQMLAPAPPSSNSNLSTYPHGGSHSGRTIQIHIQNQGPHTVNVQQYGPGAQNYLPAYTSASPEHYYHPAFHHGLSVDTPGSTPRSNSPVSRTLNQSPLSVISNTSSPSSNSDIPDKPPPPYSGRHITAQGQIIIQPKPDPVPPQTQPPPDHTSQELVDGPDETDWTDRLESCDNVEEESEILENDQSTGTMVIRSGNKILCASPKPERKPEAKKKDAERREFKVKNYSPQAYKFFMEQHVENLLKSHRQRINRRLQLEREMSKVKLPEEAQTQMRKMLHQKESNYIRLKRARMHKCLFHQIKTLGIGAFGEVALVRKGETNQLYAMKTLRKHDVLQRNQVAHVKAERDILAEADNEWVVKLYYSFQDKENLYFVMEYIPGGDMMGLLIKYGIFPESLAQFYIAELVLAIESVHKMGFIHRDIKPDNILIDKDGHIKLTDFGLCTGFRWTHNSKYYQKGNHARQDSMEPDESWSVDCNCPPKSLKPLERRKIRDHQRCLAHSLVGTPNYIAPEVLQRSGYTNSCDWWSVGVILYEMRVGQPPFLANTPAETQAKVIHWHETLNIPREARLTQPTTDLILSLCCGAEQRLGHNGANDIKKHPFFSSLKWEGLRQQNAPYIPKIMHATDTSNFDPVDPEKIRNSQSNSGMDFDMVGMYENGKHPEHAFFEFTFRRFFDDGGHPYATRMTDPEADSPVYV